VVRGATVCTNFHPTLRLCWDAGDGMFWYDQWRSLGIVPM
jgi:hypothetical protein